MVFYAPVEHFGHIEIALSICPSVRPFVRPYLKVQGHTGSLNVKLQPFVIPDCICIERVLNNLAQLFAISRRRVAR